MTNEIQHIRLHDNDKMLSSTLINTGIVSFAASITSSSFTRISTIEMTKLAE